jgi:hypothetical protein
MVRLLAGNLVHVVTMHSHGGSQANRHHTPSLIVGRHKIEPTKERGLNATSNLLELPFALQQGIGTRSPHKSP